MSENAGDFEGIMDRNSDEFKDPTPYPTGTWLLRGISTRVDDETLGENWKELAGQKAKVIQFAYVGEEPGAGVDPEALENPTFKGKRVYVRRYIVESRVDEDSNGVKKFLTKHGIDMAGRSIADGLKDFKGTVIMADLGIKTFTDKQTGELTKDNDAKNFAAAA